MGSLFQGWGKNILSNYKGSHDVELVCAHGEKIGLHKVVLALNSTLLGEVLLNMEEEKLVIIMPNFPAHLVKMCVALLYKGEVVLKNKADYARVDMCLSNMLGVDRAHQKFGVQLDNPNDTRGPQNKLSETQGGVKRQINLDANSTGLLSQPDKIMNKSLMRHSDEIVEKSLNRQDEILQKSSRKFCHLSSGITQGEKEPRQIGNIENEKSEKVETEIQPLMPKEAQNNPNHEQDDEFVLCAENAINVPATKAENKDDSLFLMLDHLEAQEGNAFMKDLVHGSRDDLETGDSLSKKGEGIYHFKPEPSAEPKLEFDPLGAETFLLKSLLLRDKQERDKTRLEAVKRQKKLDRIKRRAKRKHGNSTLINTNDFAKVKLKKEILSCHSCDFETTKVRRLERHQRREHRLFPQKKKKTLKERDSKIANIIDATIKTEITGPKVFTCKDCKYSTTNSFNLKRHEDNVHKGLLHKCDVDGCDYSNSQPGNVAGHKKVTKDK